MVWSSPLARRASVPLSPMCRRRKTRRADLDRLSGDRDETPDEHPLRGPDQPDEITVPLVDCLGHFVHYAPPSAVRNVPSSLYILVLTIQVCAKIKIPVGNYYETIVS